MSANGDFVREATQAVVEAEAEFVSAHSLVGLALAARQQRLTEAELAHRIRARFPNLETFLNAQGRAADRDVVSDSHNVEIEIKYFGARVPQGGAIPLSDWEWLVGTSSRAPARPNFERLLVSFFPQARPGVGVQGQGSPESPGLWRFQDCLSFTATDRSTYRPYWPIAELVVPRSAVDGRALEPRLSFAQNIRRRTIIHYRQNGTEIFGRADVIGEPMESPLWALVHELVDGRDAALLVTLGYMQLEDET